jgi:hypothetical protein
MSFAPELNTGLTPKHLEAHPQKIITNVFEGIKTNRDAIKAPGTLL